MGACEDNHREGGPGRVLRRAPGTWLILPTYDEAENVEAIVAAATAALERAVPGNWRLLIVDDASPDGTGALADAIAERVPEVGVLHRTAKDGLGPAYLAGFAHALDHGAARVVEMDADFSHDPGDLPRLLAAASDADLVLGSRYVPGGGVADWGPVRRLLSRGGSAYARAVLRVPIRDLTGGFKVISANLLRGIDLDAVRGQGYVFQIEITYRALLAGFRVVEVPIRFRDRERGRSKMSPRIALEAIWLIPSLRRRTGRTAISPGANGGLEPLA